MAENDEMMKAAVFMGPERMEVKELRAIGGGAKSEKWLQLKADIFDREVLSLDVSEAASLAMAMLAGVAVGEYKDVQEAVRSELLYDFGYGDDWVTIPQMKEMYPITFPEAARDLDGHS